MRNLLRSLPFYALAILLFSSFGCQNTTTSSPSTSSLPESLLQDPAPDDPAPYLYGRFLSYDESLGPKARNAGMTVHLEGTNFTAQTDSSGWWMMKYVPAGIYIVDLSKPGFGSRKLYNVQYLGREHYSLGNTWLNHMPFGAVPVIDSAKSYDGVQLWAHCIDTSLTVINGDCPMILFVSKHLVFDPTDPSSFQGKQDFIFNYSNQLIAGRAYIYGDSLTAWGFAKGDSVFVRLFQGEYGDDNYTDITTGQKIYTLYPYDHGASVGFKFF